MTKLEQKLKRMGYQITDMHFGRDRDGYLVITGYTARKLFIDSIDTVSGRNLTEIERKIRANRRK